MSLITENNWNHAFFKLNKEKALISIGANPSQTEDSDAEIIYYVSTLDAEGNEVYQEEHKFLNIACHRINQKFSDVWDFEDMAEGPDEGGCSTCVAH